jgi:hypothetical protein
VTPTARDLAMWARVKSGVQGCCVYAVDDDISVNYRVRDLSDLPPPVRSTVQPEFAQPGVGKTPEKCQTTVGDFAERRNKVEAKSAKVSEDHPFTSIAQALCVRH